MKVIIFRKCTGIATLAIFSAFSGIITDPLQARLGLHEKRLNKLVDSLEDALKDNGDSQLRLREQYLVRIFDLINLLKTAAQIVI